MKIFGTLACSIFFFILSGVTAPHRMPTIKLSKQETATTVDAKLLNFFDLGIKRIYTDILWIQTLLESDLEHYQGSDGNSWMYHRFNTISLLDPKFLENYWYGGQYLSVIKDDDIGAQMLFEKGLDIYPEDYRLLYYTGSHYLIELHDKQNALKYYQKLFDYPETPQYLKALISRLKADAGFLQESLRLMAKLYEEAPEDTALKKAYEERLYSIRTEIDLKCLNEEGTNCHFTDLFGNPYVKRDGHYQSPREWEKLRLDIKK